MLRGFRDWLLALGIFLVICGGSALAQWDSDRDSGGDVLGPTTNTADYIPQWNGANSKTLKDGLAVPAGGLAGLTALADKAPIASPTFTGTVTLPTGLTGVVRADSGIVSVDGDVTDIVTAASDSASGKVELATGAETSTGTDTGRAVTPDGLAGSNIGTKSAVIAAVAPTTDVTVADGKAYIVIPACVTGMNLIRAQAVVITAGTTNATTVDIYNVTDSVDMLSGAISIASGDTVGTVGTINTSYDDVATNDVLRIDVTTVSTTAPKGLMVVLEFQLP